MRASAGAAGRRGSEPTAGHEHGYASVLAVDRPDELVPLSGLWQALAAALEHPDAEGREKVERSPLGFLGEYAGALGLSVATGDRVSDRWYSTLGPDQDLEWRREHTELFLFAFPHARAPLYESYYLGEHNLLCETPTVEVAKAYRHLGLGVGEGIGLPADHLIFELEFLAHLAREAARAMQQGDHDDAREKLALLDVFAAEHPARWVPLLRAAVAEHSASPYYPDLIGLLDESLQRWKRVPQDTK